MLEMEIHEKACRGCRFCVEICPTECFTFDEENQKARVDKAGNCIACLSCSFICPSGAIEHRNHHLINNYYRDIEFSQRMEKFL